MKKAIIIFSVFLFPLATFGAVQIAKEIKSYEFVASVQTVKGNNVFIYKFEDKTTDCYISTMEFGMSGASQSISCVKK